MHNKQKGELDMTALLLKQQQEIHTQGLEQKRLLEQLAVVDTFPDSVTAMQRYTQLHRDAPARELYVFRTSRETLDIVERQWLGIRGV